MEIILLRHGKPLIDNTVKMSPAEFGGWVKDYDRAGIDTNIAPPNSAKEKAHQSNCVVCSHLTRSIESARVLDLEKVHYTSELFRECEIPHANLEWPKLSALSWTVLFRVAQLFGYAPYCESHQQIKCRAQECTDQLAELSRTHKSVLFVGHGTLIWFIHKRLLRGGWTGPKAAARRHWEFGVYEKNGA